MNHISFVFALFFVSTTAFSQETYKCNVGGSMVFQDRPCTGSIRRSENMPPKPAPGMVVSTTEQPRAMPDVVSSSKLEQDKEYINKRVKARIFEREKNEAAEQQQACDNEVLSIHQKISQIANSGPRGVPADAASARNIQIDQQQRQIDIAALNSQATARRADCERLRQANDRKFQKQP